MIALMKSKPGDKFVQRRKHSAGMTLFEVVVAVGILTAVLLAFLQSQASMLLVNQMTKYETSGTNVIRRQLEEIISMAYDSKDKAGGVAKGLVYYLREMKKRLDASSPVSVALNGGVLTYTFLVPEPGWSSFRGGEVSESKSATGVLRIYLREQDVPAGFRDWGDLEADGSITPSGISGFDMDGNFKYTDDFTALFADGALFGQSGLKVLPVQAEIKYYRSTVDKIADQSPVYTVTRNFLINDEALGNSEYGVASE